MEEIELLSIQGLWLGEKFNLLIGSHRNRNFGNLIDKGNGGNSVETTTLQLSERTLDNTRMLIFNGDCSIEIWSLNLAKSEMTITVNDNIYDLKLRPY